MRSISIVYKKPKALKQQNHQKEQINGVRKTVNDFYSKLMEKYSNRQQYLQKIRIQTARASKLKQRRNVVSSLSINTISTPGINLKKSPTQKKLSSQIIFNVKKPKSNSVFCLKLPEHNNEKHESLISARKNIKQVIKHSKMKLLTKIKCEKQVTIILSIDFIYNEFSFWGEESIQDACSRTWKLLQPLANILWIVRSEGTYRKLVIFCQNKGLRLDGVLQIQPNKKQPLTISYSNLQQEVRFSRNHKILIINSLRSDAGSPISQLQFRNSLPIISHASTFIHFIRIDMNNKNRLSEVKKIVTQQLPIPFNIQPIFEQHRERKGKYLSKIKLKNDFYESLESSSIPNFTEQMQKMKVNLLQYFDQTIGLKNKFEGGDSLTYIIGDIIKRNYNIGKKFYQTCLQAQQKQQNTVYPTQNHISNKIEKLCYNRPIYVWQF